MFLIRLLLRVRVARDAGEDRVIVGIGMAVPARSPYVRVGAGVNREPRVVERGPRPAGRVVAQLARGREHRGHVVRVRRR